MSDAWKVGIKKRWSVWNIFLVNEACEFVFIEEKGVLLLVGSGKTKVEGLVERDVKDFFIIFLGWLVDKYIEKNTLKYMVWMSYLTEIVFVSTLISIMLVY